MPDEGSEIGSELPTGLQVSSGRLSRLGKRVTGKTSHLRRQLPDNIDRRLYRFFTFVILPVARLLMEEHLAPAEPNVPETESPSADGRYVLVSTQTGDDTEFKKYTLTVYERETKARIGKFRSYVSLMPFFVWKSEVIYESSPYVLRTGDGVREESRKIRAVDPRRGKEIWSAEIRDAKYRGPFPP